MTVKTTRSKAQAKFDMPTIRRRAKRLMRKRHKKTISLKEVDKIWKEYVEYGIIREVLHYGYIDIDSNFRIEIEGRKILEDKRIQALLEKGLNVNGIVKPAVRWGNRDVIYKIKLIDKQCKGQIVFTAHKDFKKRVSEHLKNPNTYYKIK